MNIRTLTVKVKKPYWKRLNRVAPETNFVWNYINRLSYYMIKNRRKWLTSWDMAPYLKGASKAGLKLRQSAVMAIADRYVTNRETCKKRELKFRNFKSLGWIPFKGQDVSYKNGFFQCFSDLKVKVFDSYGLENYKLRAGNFSQDASGAWWLHIAVEDHRILSEAPTQEIGIDLGLKALATCSNGEVLEHLRLYKNYEPKLKILRKANKRKQFRNLSHRIKNKRKDQLHKITTDLVKKNKLIVIGEISSKELSLSRGHAKSIYDAGWYCFKLYLEQKSRQANIAFVKVSEYRTSVTCSRCKSRTGPKGLEGLRIREWECSNCGALHDRDVNAAINILALGRQSLAEGASKQLEDASRLHEDSTANLVVIGDGYG